MAERQEKQQKPTYEISMFESPFNSATPASEQADFLVHHFTVSAHTAPITSIVATPNFVATASLDGTIAEWDNNGRCSVIERSKRRDKTHALTSCQSDMLITGGTERFIKSFERVNNQFVLAKKIAKAQEAFVKPTIQALETIDSDKLLVGSSDETIRLYPIERASRESLRHNEPELAD